MSTKKPSGIVLPDWLQQQLRSDGYALVRRYCKAIQDGADAAVAQDVASLQVLADTDPTCRPTVRDWAKTLGVDLDAISADTPTLNANGDVFNLSADAAYLVSSKLAALGLPQHVDHSAERTVMPDRSYELDHTEVRVFLNNGRVRSTIGPVVWNSKEATVCLAHSMDSLRDLLHTTNLQNIFIEVYQIGHGSPLLFKGYAHCVQPSVVLADTLLCNIALDVSNAPLGLGGSSTKDTVVDGFKKILDAAAAQPPRSLADLKAQFDKQELMPSTILMSKETLDDLAANLAPSWDVDPPRVSLDDAVKAVYKQELIPYMLADRETLDDITRVSFLEAKTQAAVTALDKQYWNEIGKIEAERTKEALRCPMYFEKKAGPADLHIWGSDGVQLVLNSSSSDDALVLYLPDRMTGAPVQVLACKRWGEVEVKPGWHRKLNEIAQGFWKAVAQVYHALPLPVSAKQEAIIAFCNERHMTLAEFDLHYYARPLRHDGACVEISAWEIVKVEE